MKRILTSITTLLAAFALLKAQEVPKGFQQHEDFRSEVTVGKALERTIKDKQDSIAMNIIESWRHYIEIHSKAQESTAGMWVNRDTTKFIASYNGKTEKNYDHEIFRLDYYGNGEYGFSVKATYRGKVSRETYGLRSMNYYLYSIENEEGIKFMTPLDYGVYKNEIIRKTCGLIDFYFPRNLKVTEDEMKKCGDFIDMLVSTFELKDLNRINYIMSENHAHASLLAGIMISEDKRASGVNAEYIYPDTILAGRICHKHELTHAVLYQHYPDAHRLIHEGMAIYMDTDAAGKYSMAEHMSKIKKIKDADDLMALLQTDTKFYYSIARHIIKTIVENEGCHAILNVMKLKTDEEVYELVLKVL